MATDIKQNAIQQVVFMRWYTAAGAAPAELHLNYTHPDGHTVQTGAIIEHNAETATLVNSIAALNGLVPVPCSERCWGEWHTGPDTFKLQGWEE